MYMYVYIYIYVYISCKISAEERQSDHIEHWSNIL